MTTDLIAVVAGSGRGVGEGIAMPWGKRAEIEKNSQKINE